MRETQTTLQDEFSSSPLCFLELRSSEFGISLPSRNTQAADSRQRLRIWKRIRDMMLFPAGPLGRQTKKRAIIKDYRKTTGAQSSEVVRLRQLLLSVAFSGRVFASFCENGKSVLSLCALRKRDPVHCEVS